MPVEFLLEPTGSSSDTTRLVMMYDGSGRRISKTILSKSSAATSWDTVKVTHYTGIGTEIREEFAGPAKETKVVVNMPQGLGRYGIENAVEANAVASKTFEWYLKNHLGSTMLVYGTVVSTAPNNADIGETKAAYDYRAFGEMVELMPHDLAKVTENFTGKEHDDEIALNYFGARYLDPMLGMWTSVDPARQFASPYLYAGNGMNPINGFDPDGNEYVGDLLIIYNVAVKNEFWGSKRMEYELNRFHSSTKKFDGKLGNYRFRGHKQYGEIKINKNLSEIEQAATLVHESLENTADMRNGKMVQYIPQEWHVPTTEGENSVIQDIFWRYFDEETGKPSYDDFLKANYEGRLENQAGNPYPSDEVYKAEYECLHGL